MRFPRHRVTGRSQALREIAGIAQLVEQRIRNAKVVGSTPISGTSRFKHLQHNVPQQSKNKSWKTWAKPINLGQHLGQTVSTMLIAPVQSVARWVSKADNVQSVRVLGFDRPQGCLKANSRQSDPHRHPTHRFLNWFHPATLYTEFCSNEPVNPATQTPPTRHHPIRPGSFGSRAGSLFVSRIAKIGGELSNV